MASPTKEELLQLWEINERLQTVIVQQKLLIKEKRELLKKRDRWYKEQRFKAQGVTPIC